MEGKTCIVTGASSGIGKATALGLAKMGATVVTVSRNEAEGRAAQEDIQKGSGNNSVDLLVADLSSLDAVRNLAARFKEKHRKLHVLVNNAGTFFTKRHETIDGLEMTFVVNYLSRFLLTHLLLDVLKDSAPSRIVEVAGAYHTKGQINFDDLQSERDYNGMKANAQSKLANVLFTHELARRLKGTGVTINCLHPGIVATKLIESDRDYPSFLKALYRLFKPFIKTPEQGAETVLYLATSPEVAEVSGEYFVDKKAVKSSPASYDEDLAARLWRVSEKLTGINAS